jgi:hypothetical protein
MASSCGSDVGEEIVELDCTWLIVMLHDLGSISKSWQIAKGTIIDFG